MKKLLWLSLLCISGCLWANVKQVDFFQTASKASVTKLHDNNYILTLYNPPQFLSYFMKKPERKAGAIPLSAFLSLWRDKTTARVPNAALAMVSSRGEYQQAEIIVTNPSQVKQTVSYQISSPDGPLPLGQFKYLVLVFDELSWDLDNL